MASETIKEFLVGIGFEVDDKGLNEFGAKVKKFSVGVAAAVAASAAGFYALSKAVTSTAQKFDDLGDAAERIGTSAYDIEKFAYAAELSGSTMGVAKNSLENFAKRVGETAMGVGRAKVIFENLGIAVQSADGEMRDSADILAEVGDKVKDLSKAEQLAVLDKLGLDPTLLNTITGGLQALGDEFDALYAVNGVNIQAAAESADKFNDMIFRLKYTLESFKDALASQLLAPMADAMYSITKRFTEFMQVTLKALQPFFKTIGNVFAGLIKIFARVFVGAVSLISSIARPFAWFYNQMPGWAKIVGGLTLACYTLWKAFAVSPIGAVVALGVAIAALVDDFLVWKEGGQSFLDWSAWEPAINAACDAIGRFTQFFRDLFSVVFSLVGIIGDLLTGNFEGVFQKWQVAIGSAASAVQNLFGWFSSLKDFLGGMLGGVGSMMKAGLNEFGITAFDEWLPGEKQKVLADVKGGGTSNNVQVQSNIIVQGAADPRSTAREVGALQNNVYQSAVRNATARAG